MTTRKYNDLSHLTPEQKKDHERKKQRERYRLKNPKVRKDGMTQEERREWYRQNYRKKMDAKGVVPFKDRPKLTKAQKAERKRKWYEKKRLSEGKSYRSKGEITEVIPKPPKVILTREEQLLKWREAAARQKAKKDALKPKTMPKVKPLRKAKPKEIKEKPAVLPTLVRDESDFVSVRIDAKTSLWVHRDRAEEVRSKYKLA